MASQAPIVLHARAGLRDERSDWTTQVGAEST